MSELIRRASKFLKGHLREIVIIDDGATASRLTFDDVA